MAVDLSPAPLFPGPIAITVNTRVSKSSDHILEEAVPSSTSGLTSVTSTRVMQFRLIHPANKLRVQPPPELRPLPDVAPDCYLYARKALVAVDIHEHESSAVQDLEPLLYIIDDDPHRPDYLSVGLGTKVFVGSKQGKTIEGKVQQLICVAKNVCLFRVWNGFESAMLLIPIGMCHFPYLFWLRLLVDMFRNPLFELFAKLLGF